MSYKKNTAEEAIIYILRMWKQRIEGEKRYNHARRDRKVERTIQWEKNHIKEIEDARIRDVIKHMNILKEI